MRSTPYRTHNAAGAIARCIRGKVTFLIIRAVIKDGPDKGKEIWKLAGGDGEPGDNGNPLKNFLRELKEETDLVVRQGRSEEIEEIAVSRVNRGHVRYLYFAWYKIFTGILRTTIREEDHLTLYPPEWRDYEFVEQHLVPSQWAILPKLKGIAEGGLRLCA
jgi:hypothetical protein